MECCAHTTGKETETHTIREFSQGDVKPGPCDSKVCPNCQPEGEALFFPPSLSSPPQLLFLHSLRYYAAQFSVVHSVKPANVFWVQIRFWALWSKSFPFNCLLQSSWQPDITSTLTSLILYHFIYEATVGERDALSRYFPRSLVMQLSCRKMGVF